MSITEHARDGSDRSSGPPAGCRQRIDDLARALTGPDQSDVHALTAATGLAWFGVYEDEGDESAFDAGAACLHQCLTAAPDHADRHRWQLWLGLGQAERGRQLERISDYHGSIERLTDLYTRADLPDDLRDQVATTLIDLCCDRIWLLRREDAAVPRSLHEVLRLVSHVSAQLTNSTDPGGRSRARVLTGIALLELYELTNVRSDLDRGVDLLAAAVWDIEPGTALLSRVGAELANGLRRQGVLDYDLTLLDQAVSVADRAAREGNADDHASRALLYVFQAYAYEARWQLTDDTADLGASLTCWRTALGNDDLTLADGFTGFDPSPSPEQ